MKKIFPIIVGSLLLSACQQKITPNQISTTQDTNIFTSIKDAISKEMLLKCEYKDEDSTVITYIKGNTVRFQGTGEEASISGLMKDGKYYLWEEGRAEGLVLDIQKLTEDGTVKMGNTVIKNQDDVVAKLEEQKQNCQISPASASLMELPGNIKFAEDSGFFGEE